MFPQHSGIFFQIFIGLLFLLFVFLIIKVGPVLLTAFDILSTMLLTPPVAPDPNLDPAAYAVAKEAFEQQQSSYRFTALAFFGVLTAVGGLIGYAFSFIRAFASERQTVATEQGHITDRITKAVEQLGA